jgi:hypothetical protein
MTKLDRRNMVAPMRRLVSPKGEGRYARPFLLKGRCTSKSDHSFASAMYFSKGVIRSHLLVAVLMISSDLRSQLIFSNFATVELL